MAIFGVSNQLLQIDTGKVRTYLYNPSLGFAPWAGLGENQVLGQRYFGVTGSGAANPSGAPAIFMLVQYKSTAQPTPQTAPAPVYWTDETYTTVSGVYTEGLLGPNGTAGYLMVNTTDLTTLTAAILQGSYCVIQVAGQLVGAYGPTSGTAGVGNLITPLTGNFQSQNVVASNTASGPACRPFGVQSTALASGLCDVLVNCDII
jgi:hypothetical protein